MLHDKIDLPMSLKMASVIVLAIVISACGASGGAESEDSDDPRVEGDYVKPTVTYTSSIDARNEDVKHFRTYVWSELASAEVCGACHAPGGPQGDTFPFAHPNDINAAYDSLFDNREAINRNNASDSLLSLYLGSGSHTQHCWLGEENAAQCANLVASYISQWLAAAAPSSFLAALKEGATEIEQKVSTPPSSDPADANKSILDIRSGKQFVADVPAGYASLHSLLNGKGQCSQCHAPSRPAGLDSSLSFIAPQQPYFAVDSMQASYDAVKGKLDINNVSNSRIYVRISSEGHNCWTNNCASDAIELYDEIDTFVNGVPQRDGDGNPVVDSDGNIVYNVEPSLPVVEPPADLLQFASKGLVVQTDGIVLSAGSRVEDNAIGVWDFKRNENDPYVASNIAPSGIPLDLRFTSEDNIEWWGSGGVRIINGQLKASSIESNVLYERIRDAGNYSIEAWLIPLNVTQGENNPASVVSYSQTTDARNFMLGQRIYNYDFYNRNTLAGSTPANVEAGLPFLGSDEPGTENEEVVQASLQHVVLTYDETDGRRVYVNGELIIEENDPSLSGTFADWESGFSLVVGNEASGGRQWQGSVRLLAIHAEALGIDDIATNYEIGVGEKYYLLFPIEHLTDGYDDTYIVFRVEEFDDHSYLFSEPLFYSADGEATIDGLDFSGMRIGINAREAGSGQAFINLSSIIDSTDAVNYIFDPVLDDDGNVLNGQFNDENGGMQRLSRIGTIIPQENGINEDQFFLTFDSIAGDDYIRPAVTFELPPEGYEDIDQSLIGLKTFAEINASLASLTGISPANSVVSDVYETVKQQMPVTENMSGFVAAQQMGIAQLAFAYCSELVDISGNTTVDFDGFVFSDNPSAAFNSDSKKAQIIDPLLANLLANEVTATQTDDQPVPGNTFDSSNIPDSVNGTRDILSWLIDEMVSVGVNDTPKIAKATCTAAYSSALMLVQ